MASNPIAEPRMNGGERYPVHILDRSKLQYEVKDAEAVCFHDEKTKRVIGFVSGYVFEDEEVVSVLNGTVVSHLNATLKTVRVSFISPCPENFLEIERK